jgi:hypothetical protein
VADTIALFQYQLHPQTAVPKVQQLEQKKTLLEADIKSVLSNIQRKFGLINYATVFRTYGDIITAELTDSKYS